MGKGYQVLILAQNLLESKNVQLGIKSHIDKNCKIKKFIFIDISLVIPLKLGVSHYVRVTSFAINGVYFRLAKKR